MPSSRSVRGSGSGTKDGVRNRLGYVLGYVGVNIERNTIGIALIADVATRQVDVRDSKTKLRRPIGNSD